LSTIEVEHASRWYGNVVAVNDVTMEVGPGVTGLLGPNGAGKSTLLHMMSGFLAPSIGTVQVDGRPVWHDHDLYRTIGLVPERDAVYGYLTGWQLALASARLHGLPHTAHQPSYQPAYTRIYTLPGAAHQGSTTVRLGVAYRKNGGHSCQSQTGAPAGSG